MIENDGAGIDGCFVNSWSNHIKPTFGLTDVGTGSDLFFPLKDDTLLAKNKLFVS